MNNEELKLKLMNILTDLELHLVTLDPNSEEYQQTLTNINTVTKTIFDLDAKVEEKTDRKKERIIKIALGVGGFVVTGLGYLFCRRNFTDTLAFESQGTIPSQGGRHALNDALRLPK